MLLAGGDVGCNNSVIINKGYDKEIKEVGSIESCSCSHGLTIGPQNSWLRRLPRVEDALYSYAPLSHLRGPRTKQTRKDFIVQLVDWVGDQDRPAIAWLDGRAGTGKTTVAYSLAHILQSAGFLGGTFFCSRQIDDTLDVRKIFPTLALSFAGSSASFRDRLVQALQNKPDAGLGKLKEQFISLFQEPIGDGEFLDNHPVFIIDGLDECRDAAAVQEFLKTVSLSRGLPIKILLSSERSSSLSSIIPECDMCKFVLHDVPSPIVSSDIRIFLTTKLPEMALGSTNLPKGWPPSDEVDILVSRSSKFVSHSFVCNHVLIIYFSSLFLYSATVCRYIGNGGPNRVGKRLTEACSPGFQPRPQDFTAIDSLYRGILSQALDNLNDRERANVEDIVKTVITMQDPLPASSISRLLGLAGSSSAIEELADLHSVIVLPETADGLISVFHTMFIEFIRDEARSSPYHFPSYQSHYLLAQRCLMVLEGNLKDIFNSTAVINFPATTSTIGQAEIDAAFPPEVQYAVLRVVDHIILSRDAADLPLLQLIYSFYHKCYVEWLQCLSIMRRLSKDSHWLKVAQHFNAVSRVLGSNCISPSNGYRFQRNLEYLKICRHLTNISRLVSDADLLNTLKESWREIRTIAESGRARQRNPAV